MQCFVILLVVKADYKQHQYRTESVCTVASNLRDAIYRTKIKHVNVVSIIRVDTGCKLLLQRF